jgi:hypothetical protein
LLGLKVETGGNANFIRERLWHRNHFGSFTVRPLTLWLTQNIEGIIDTQNHDCPRGQRSDVVKSWVYAWRNPSALKSNTSAYPNGVSVGWTKNLAHMLSNHRFEAFCSLGRLCLSGCFSKAQYIGAAVIRPS